MYSSQKNELKVPAIPGRKVVKAYFLDGGSSISCSQSANSLSLLWNIKMPDPVCNVIVVEMDENIDIIPIIKNRN